MFVPLTNIFGDFGSKAWWSFLEKNYSFSLWTLVVDKDVTRPWRWYGWMCFHWCNWSLNTSTHEFIKNRIFSHSPTVQSPSFLYCPTSSFHLRRLICLFLLDLRMAVTTTVVQTHRSRQHGHKLKHVIFVPFLKQTFGFSWVDLRIWAEQRLWVELQQKAGL